MDAGRQERSAGDGKARSEWRRLAPGILAFLIGYAILATLSYRVIIPQSGVPAFWFANGLAMGVLVRARFRQWPLLLLALVFAAVWANWFQVRSLGGTLPWVGSDLIEATVGASLIRLLAGRQTRLARLRDVFAFILGGLVVAPFLASLLGALGSASRSELSYAELVAFWWVTDALGVAAVTSLLLTWVGPDWRLTHDWGRSAETFLVALALAAVLGLVFQLESTLIRPLFLVFTTFPILSLTSLYYGPRGASTIAAATGAVALWQTFEGMGPFSEAGTFSLQLLGVQVFFALASVTALIVAAVGEDRRALRARAQLHSRQVEESVAVLDAVLENAPIGFVLFDTELRMMRVNSALAESNGTSVEAHLGKTLREVLPDIEKQVGGLLRQSLEEGRSFSAVEVTGVPRNEDRMHTWLETFYPVRLPEGTVVGVGAWILDITERMEKQELLALSEERFRTLAVATAEVVWICDPEGENMESPSWLEYTGQRPEDLRGLGWMDAVHPDDRASTREAWRVAKEKGALETEYRMRRRDGVYRYHQAMAAPVLDASGRIREWVGMSFDISARKKAEAERARLFEQAQQAIKARDDFLSIASHELKTPLTPLSTRLQILERRLHAGEPLDAELIEKARLSLDRLTILINDLLDASRIQAGRFSLRLAPLSFTRLIREHMATLAPTLAGREVRVELEEPELWVRGDRTRLEQVLSNLIDNAAKYSPASKPIRVRLESRDGEVLLSVADQGIGIPADQQRLLFQRFFRARSAEGYGGLGLGLYIIRDIVERHGGRIWVRSRLGVGSTFYVSIPRIAPPREQAKEQAPA